VTSKSRIEWRVPAYLPYVQPALTDAVVRDAERRLRLRLPEVYVAALRIQNGGYLRFRLPDLPVDQMWGIGPRYPSILEGSLDERHAGEGWLPNGADALVPFVGDGHWYLCFDARDGRDEPAITHVDLECERGEPVAATFAELAMRFAPDPDRAVIGIATRASLAEVAHQLAKPLQMKVFDQGDVAHGYPTYLCRKERRGTIRQFWVSPNEVRRGFVRPDDREYAALANALPGTALRWPEHPGCRLLLVADNTMADDLMTACARAGLPAVRL
jgi:SMI1/KNR4 family protein SUKH-1